MPIIETKFGVFYILYIYAMKYSHRWYDWKLDEIDLVGDGFHNIVYL